MRSQIALLSGVFLFFTLLVVPATAETWYILPDGTGDAPTIQAGLDLCVSGDIVLVAEGTYMENLIWPEVDGIVLRSESGSDLTKIDGGEISRVILMANGLSGSSEISGFTIQNGKIYGPGGGILCSQLSSPTIINNKIINNTALSSEGVGGGIACNNGSSPTISHNIITGNNGELAGGGIAWLNSSNPTISHNDIRLNTSYAGGGIYVGFNSGGYVTGNFINRNQSTFSGGGICSQEAHPTFRLNFITENIAVTRGGGVTCVDEDEAVFTYNSITGNTADYGAGFYFRESTLPVIENCIIADNIGGGVYTENCAPTICYNNIMGNTDFGIRNSTIGENVCGTFNWWGDASGPSGEGPGAGDGVSLNVDFEPWSEELYLLPSGVGSQSTPTRSMLLQIYPNPFNPQTTIKFVLDSPQRVEIAVYDVSGRLLSVLANRNFTADSQSVVWNGTDSMGFAVPSGTYLVRLSTESTTESRKVMLLR